MAEGKSIAIGLLALGLVITSVGFANYYLQTSLANQQISFLQESEPTTTHYELVTQTTVSIVPITLTTTNFQTVTNTSTSTLVSTSLETVSTTSVSTYSTTYTTSETTTQTTSIFPPSNSTYALTFMNGSAIGQFSNGCCTEYFSVRSTYEMHSSVPNNIEVWVELTNGQIIQVSPTVFTNQAYLTLNVETSYAYSLGGANSPYLLTWVTDGSNNVLSPTINFTVT